MTKKELIKKLHSMRFSERDVQGKTSLGRNQFIYGYTECINELLIWVNKEHPSKDNNVIEERIKEFLKMKGIDVDNCAIYNMKNIKNPRIPVKKWIKELLIWANKQTENNINNAMKN
jgi:hypothetical protein